MTLPFLCWHKWSKWSAPAYGGITHLGEYSRQRVMQLRTCEHCGKAQHRVMHGLQVIPKPE